VFNAEIARLFHKHTVTSKHAISVAAI